jgi:hypothetical protein
VLSVRARRVFALLPLTAALVAGVSGCGGDDGPKAGSDQARITDLARFVVTAPTGDAMCSTQLASDFVSAVFGDVSTCRRAGADNKPEDNATGATVSDIAVDGDSATAVVTEQGGAADGASGTWGFVRNAAAGWRVAEWRIDYLRAEFKAQFGPAYRSDGSDDPFGDATVRGCVSDRFQGLADPEFRATAYEILRGSDSGDEALKGWYYDCIASGKTQGVSTLRRIFEDGLRQADSIPPQVIECVVQKLRKTVSDKEIRTMGESGAAKTPPAIEKRIERATVDCVDSTGAA